jgi:mono/diheme cytochrome c family protein
VKPRDFAEGSFKFDPDGDGTTGEIEDIVAVIRDGAARYGGSPTMVPWASLLDEAQLQAVAEHVKEFGRSS